MKEKQCFLDKIPFYPDFLEIYLTWTSLQNDDTSAAQGIQTFPPVHVNSILLHAFKNMSSDVFSIGRPTTLQAIAALDGHLHFRVTSLDRTILDFPTTEDFTPSILRDPLILQVWDTNKILTSNNIVIRYNDWHLRWFKLRLLQQSHILHSIRRASANTTKKHSGLRCLVS